MPDADIFEAARRASVAVSLHDEGGFEGMRRAGRLAIGGHPRESTGTDSAGRVGGETSEAPKDGWLGGRQGAVELLGNGGELRLGRREHA